MQRTRLKSSLSRMSIKMMGDFEHPVGKLIRTGSCPFEIQNKTIIRQDISPQETTFNFAVKVYIKHHVSVNFIFIRDQEQGLHFNPVIFAALTRNLFISVFLCAENAFNDFRYR